MTPRRRPAAWTSIAMDLQQGIAPDYTVLYCTVLHCTILHCTILHCTIIHITVLQSTKLHYNVLNTTTPYIDAPHRTVLHHRVRPRAGPCVTSARILASRRKLIRYLFKRVLQCCDVQNIMYSTGCTVQYVQYRLYSTVCTVQAVQESRQITLAEFGTAQYSELN